MVQKWKAMEEAEAEPERQRHMITRSSIKRKPLSNLTNLIPNSYHSSKKPKSHTPTVSSKSGSSIGSTQNPNNVVKDQITVRTNHPLPTSPTHAPNPDGWVGDENCVSYSQRYSTHISRRKTKSDAVPVNGTSLEKTHKDRKERTVALPCSVVEKTIDKGNSIDMPINGPSLEMRRNDVKDRSLPRSSSVVEKIMDVPANEPSLDRTWNDGKERSVSRGCSVPVNKDKGKSIAVPATCPSLEKTRKDGKELAVATMDKTKDKGKAIAVPLTCPPMKNAKSNMEAICVTRYQLKSKDKGKEIDVPINQPLLEKTMNDGKQKTVSLPGSMVEKTKDKGKAIAIPASFPAMKNPSRNMEDIRVPLSGVKIMDKGKAVNVGSGFLDLARKDKGKAIATPFHYRTLEKKDKESSCPPLLKTRNNRNGVDGVEDTLQSKSQTDPQPIKKKRRCSSKGDAKEYVLPQEFIDQQRAYFKEIDEFELEVEEVSGEEDK